MAVQVFTQTYTTQFTSGSGVGTGVAGACTGSDITCIAQTVLYLINSVFVPTLFAVAFLTFLYGVATAYVFSNGEQAQVAKGHRIILWGLLGFVIMVSLWGLVNVVSATFGLAGATVPPIPQIAPGS